VLALRMDADDALCPRKNTRPAATNIGQYE